MRLNKYIAQSGYCSRRKADELIESGKVFVNDKPPVLGTKIDPETDTVRIKGGPTLVNPSQQKVIIIALNKPKGYVCTKNREQSKRVIYDLLPNQYQNLNSVGRLDKDSEGLILLTNDGNLANELTHPKFGKEKEYFATVRGKVSEKDIAQIQKGMRLLKYKTAPAKAKFISYDEKENRSVVHIILKEGKNQQIRNMFLALKKPVKKLVRTEFGKWKLSGLKTGEWRRVKNV